MREGKLEDGGGAGFELPQPMHRAKFVWQHPQELRRISVRCPACGNRLKAELGAIGRVGRCPACSTRFHVQPVKRAG